MLSRCARVRFAVGDFAFNLLWQSVSIYLLYYYTDVLGMGVEAAALLYMAASVWDGLADVVVGGLLDRLGGAGIPYRCWLVAGTVPLGLAFVLVYAAPLMSGGRSVAVLLAAQLAFRTLYAATNVPYVALTSRITEDSSDRASIAGLRMGFGTLAAAIVAFGTGPIGHLTSGHVDNARGFLAVAVLLAAVATAALLPVALALRERVPRMNARRGFALALWRGLIRNDALLSLNAAMAASVVAMTVTTKITLYYFKYALGNAGAGQQALGLLGLVGGLAIPAWMRLGRRVGGRHVFVASCALALLAIVAYATVSSESPGIAQAFLCAMQVAFVGINFAFWSLLPDTIEYGERATGLRMEGTTFGVAALLQKLALAAATGVFGVALGAIGYRANVAQTPATLAGMRLILLALPAAALIVSAACIAANPLRRGTHARIVAQLGKG